jgi:Tol biopolymer transport system component
MTRPLVAALVLALFGPVYAQVFPEYGAIIKHGAKPGPFRFPTVPMPHAKQPAGKEPIGDIAFVHRGDIYTVTLDGKYVRRLTTDGRNAFPLWSPNGRYIAFTKSVLAKSGSPSAVLYIITTDGKYSRALGRPEVSKAMYPIAWLPDGKGLLTVLQYLESDVGEELRVIALDGKPYPKYHKWVESGRKAGFYGERDLYEFTAGEAGTFSPDGKRMVFTGSTQRLRDSYLMDLYGINIDGTCLRRLAMLSKTIVSCLRWHPGGAKILSAETHRTETGEDESAIWLRDKDGKPLKKLADLPAASLAGIDWSPKGDYIIFQVQDREYPRLEVPTSFSELSARSSIWVMKADGSGKYKLADDACHPNWR